MDVVAIENGLIWSYSALMKDVIIVVGEMYWSYGSAE